METIRIVRKKRNKGSGFLWGFLLAVVIAGLAAWLLLDQNILDRDHLSVNRDTIENENYDEYSNSDQPHDSLESSEIKAYVSYVNREVIPADSIEKQTTKKAAALLQAAVEEVNEGTDPNYRGSAGNGSRSLTSPDSGELSASNPMERSDSGFMGSPGKGLNQQYDRETLIETGNTLADIQEREYPSLSKMGELLKKSVNDLESSKKGKSEDLKVFFIASSSLLQEMDSQRTMNRLSYNRIKK